MPKNWLYFIALVLPLLLRLLLLNTGFVDWLWYQHHADAYYFFSAIKTNSYFLQFIGGWPYPVFCATACIHWQVDDHPESIPDFFLLIPLAYVPFTIIGDILVTGHFTVSNLYVHPLIIIPAGYAYVFIWVAFVWVLEKMRLVL